MGYSKADRRAVIALAIIACCIIAGIVLFGQRKQPLVSVPLLPQTFIKALNSPRTYESHQSSGPHRSYKSHHSNRSYSSYSSNQEHSTYDNPQHCRHHTPPTYPRYWSEYCPMDCSASRTTWWFLHCRANPRSTIRRTIDAKMVYCRYYSNSSFPD